jgi:hypothetical protein
MSLGMITPAQCRMARAALRWEMQTLSETAGVFRDTLLRFEGEQGGANRATLAVIRQAFEEAGVEFVDGHKPGVLFAPPGEVP